MALSQTMFTTILTAIFPRQGLVTLWIRAADWSVLALIFRMMCYISSGKNLRAPGRAVRTFDFDVIAHVDNKAGHRRPLSSILVQRSPTRRASRIVRRVLVLQKTGATEDMVAP